MQQPPEEPKPDAKPFQRKDPVASGGVSSTETDPEGVQEYWTPERMADAVPREVRPETRDRPRTESGPDSTGD